MKLSDVPKSILLGFLIICLCSSTIAAQSIVRGPYLQMATQNSMQIRWRTDVPVESRVKYGLNYGDDSWEVYDSQLVTEHALTITSLQAATVYFYAIYDGTAKLEGSTENFFRTLRPVGSTEKLRLWVTGDCGTGSVTQAKVKNEFLNYIGADTLDAWLLLGDNAYVYGYDAEYQTRFFEPYQSDKIMKQTPIYPCPGNHDYANSATLQQSHAVPYYDIFTLPVSGELGGVPSATEAYYSYDIGNVHCVSIDSYGKETADGLRLSDTLTSPQIAWLKQDLAANTAKWTILYWHHPPYTMGSHNSDNETELRLIREKVLPIIETYHVDMVMCGHSHNYERSKLMKGYFGLEAAFDAALYVKDSSSAFYDGSENSCPYLKSSSAPNEGIIYVVAGAAGNQTAEQAAWPHDALYFSNGAFGGSLYLEIEGNRLDAKWLAEDGNIYDKFTIVKDYTLTGETVTVPPNDTTVTLNAPDSRHTKWDVNPNVLTGQLTVSNPLDGMKFHVKDSLGCFDYVFTIQKNSPCNPSQTVNNVIDSGSVLHVKASDNIIGNARMLSPVNVIYDATNKIILEPGFESSGGVFETNLNGCIN